jgi:hypothetical protein
MTTDQNNDFMDKRVDAQWCWDGDTGDRVLMDNKTSLVLYRIPAKSVSKTYHFEGGLTVAQHEELPEPDSDEMV